MGGEEDVEAVVLDCATTVEDFDGLVVVIAGDYHFCAEGISFVRGDECFVWLDFVS